MKVLGLEIIAFKSASVTFTHIHSTPQEPSSERVRGGVVDCSRNLACGLLAQRSATKDYVATLDVVASCPHAKFLLQSTSPSRTCSEPCSGWMEWM